MSDDVVDDKMLDALRKIAAILRTLKSEQRKRLLAALSIMEGLE